MKPNLFKQTGLLCQFLLYVGQPQKRKDPASSLHSVQRCSCTTFHLEKTESPLTAAVAIEPVGFEGSIFGILLDLPHANDVKHGANMSSEMPGL